MTKAVVRLHFKPGWSDDQPFTNPMNNEFQPVPGQGHASVEVLADAMRITPAERLKIAELIRRREIPLGKKDRLPVEQIAAMLRELRHEQ